MQLEIDVRKMDQHQVADLKAKKRLVKCSSRLSASFVKTSVI